MFKIGRRSSKKRSKSFVQQKTSTLKPARDRQEIKENTKKKKKRNNGLFGDAVSINYDVITDI